MNLKQITLAVHASMLIIALGAGLLHWRLVTNQSSTLAAIHLEADQMESKIAGDTVRQQLTTLNQQLADQHNIIPITNEAAPVLEMLARDLQSLNVTERSLTTGPSVINGSISQLPLNVTFRGSFASVFEWLERVHHYDRLVRVERLILRRDTFVSDANGSLTVTARLDTFGRAVEGTP